MNLIRFEWDPVKAETNLSKHGITFTEAQTVFYDESAILFDDPEHSDDENRLLIIGFSSQARLLIVCHCIRGKENAVRIISARKATRTERRQYSEINRGWRS